MRPSFLATEEAVHVPREAVVQSLKEFSAPLQQRLRSMLIMSRWCLEQLILARVLGVVFLVEDEIPGLVSRHQGGVRGHKPSLNKMLRQVVDDRPRETDCDI
jgi:hypothetical protein